MLIISSIRDSPTGKNQSFTRAMYLIPSIVCAGLLASSGQVIDLNGETVTTVAPDGAITTETHVKTFTLISEVWILFHFMIFILLVFHVLLQCLTLLTKVD